MSFRDREKIRYKEIENDIFENDPFFGVYGKTPRTFCLLDSRKNINSEYREIAIQYFRNRKIPWHDGLMEFKNNDLPSNHLCCSQSACVNYFMPFMNDKNGLKLFLIGLGYSVNEVLPIELDNIKNENIHNYVGFEWIGEKNYLNEKMRSKIRSRGKYFTSADFVFRFKQNDKKIRIVLGEWKYTEYYTINKNMRFSKNKTDRYKIYYDYLRYKNSHFNIEENEFKHLFYDPFDQLMRLQLLAQEMEKNKEMNSDIVSTIHIVPKANREFNYKITSPNLSKYGSSVHEIWEKITKKDKFKGLYLEEIHPLFSNAYSNRVAGIYIDKRYKIESV